MEERSFLRIDSGGHVVRTLRGSNSGESSLLQNIRKYLLPWL
jgi:hypothetical protein